jgi:hypothetical protein
MKNLELIHFILNNKFISSENLFNDEFMVKNFSYRIYSDNEYVLIGFSYRNNGGYYEYINLNFDYLLKTDIKILNIIASHISQYVKNN